MRYFLDTEFNGFGGALISLALVPEEDGRAAFYAATTCDDPTDWVRTHVLPFLEIDPVAPDELGRRMAAYLRNDEDPLLVADWPEDIALAARADRSARPSLSGRAHPLRAVRHLRVRLADGKRRAAQCISRCGRAQAARPPTRAAALSDQ